MKFYSRFLVLIFALIAIIPYVSAKELTPKQVVRILNLNHGVLIGSAGEPVEPRSSEGRSIIDTLKDLNLKLCLSSAKYCLDCDGGGASSSALCGKMCKCPSNCEQTSPGSVCGQLDEGTVLVFEP